ncbi:DNA-3-methyladenine glycosylase II [Ranunculus cassubicifolius]
MVEISEIQSPSLPTHDSTTTPPPPTTSPPPPTTNHHPIPPPQTTTISKLPFRSGKSRKLSPNSTPNNPNPRVRVPNQTRNIPTNLAKTLSSEGEIERAIQHLRSADPLLSQLIDLHSPPLFDSFLPPFLALTKSILYQQLAFKAGNSVYTRFISLCGGESGVVPETVLALEQWQLRQIGVSNRKTSYLQDLAKKYCNGILSDTSIVAMDDKSLFTMLSMVKGIGAWSVHMFMIFSLHRPDVLPTGDLGVRKGVQLLYELEELPRPSQMDNLCQKWRPYRSVASWYMWKFAEANGGGTNAVAMGGETVQEQPSQQLLQLPSFNDSITDPMHSSMINLG